MKKLVFAVLTLLGVCAWSGTSFAAPDPFSITVTDTDHTTNPVSVFDLSKNMQPWLYMTLPEGTKYDLTAWSSLNKGSTIIQTFGTTNNNQVWVTVPGWAGLTNLQKVGDWDVTGSYATDSTPLRSLSANFKAVAPVAPEPISAMLFLFGGIGLGLRRFFGRKSA